MFPFYKENFGIYRSLIITVVYNCNLLSIFTYLSKEKHGQKNGFHLGYVQGLNLGKLKSDRSSLESYISNSQMKYHLTIGSRFLTCQIKSFNRQECSLNEERQKRDRMKGDCIFGNMNNCLQPRDQGMSQQSVFVKGCVGNIKVI